MTKKTQRLWVLEILSRLAARHAQTFLDRLARALHYLRNLSGVITMQKTQDQHAARLRCFFAHAGVFTDFAQLILQANSFSRIGGAQPNLRRIVIDNRNRPMLSPRGTSQLRQVKIAQQAIQIAVQIANRVEVRLGKGKLNVGVVDQVFGPLAIVLGQLQSPRAQLAIPREEHFLVSLEVTSNSRRL